MRIAYLIVSIAVLINSGCLGILIGAGVASGCYGAAYLYAKGKLCTTFNTQFEDAWSATVTAFNELGMPVVKENRAKGYLDGHTADGARVRVSICSHPSRIPAEGVVTRVCVRVGVCGDKAVSERILGQIAAHLAPVLPAPCGPPQPPPTANPQLAPPVPAKPGL
jgi:hypothetical protein